jgi:MCP family monocarboxylic acid transporter-like MFS transporter 13
LNRPSRVFYGWWIVAISIVIDALKHGAFNRGISFYVLPVSKELGIGVAAISFADMMGRLLGGLLGPLAGYATDRFGPRAMLIFGGVTSGLGFVLLAFTTNYIYFILVFVGLISLGLRSGYNNATVPALNQWFRRRRAFAMSVASTGNGLGGLALAPIVGALVLTLGWRNAAIVSGIAIIVVVVPLSLLVRRSPERMGLLPDGDDALVPDSPAAPAPAQVIPVERGFDETTTVADRRSQGALDADFTTREAMVTLSYWLLVLAVGLRNTVHSGMSFLLVPVMVWFLEGGGRSQEASQAITIPFVAALSFGTIVLNPLVGWIGDSWSKLKLSSIAMVSGAFAMVALMDHSGHLWQVALFVLLLAISESTNPLAWAIMGDFFGRRSFATLRGWQHLPDQLMSMSTPVWMGLIVERTGSYYWALIPLAAIYGLSAVCYLVIPRPRPPARLLSVRA